MKTMIQYFEWYLEKEDKLWDSIPQQARYIKELGIDYVWSR